MTHFSWRLFLVTLGLLISACIGYHDGRADRGLEEGIDSFWND